MSTIRGDLYGWRNLDLSEAAERVARALSVDFELRHSYFRGGDYYNWNGGGGAGLILQWNFRDHEGELAYPQFPEYSVLLHASLLDASVYDIIARLPGVERLKSRTYEVPDD